MARSSSWKPASGAYATRRATPTSSPWRSRICQSCSVCRKLARIEGPDARLAKPFDLDALLEMVLRLSARGGTAGLAVGIPLLDAEHEVQLDLAHGLAGALRQGRDMQQAVRLLDELINCTVDHFSNERELMLRHSYPDSMSHLAEHARWVSELQRLRAADRARTGGPTAGEAMALEASLERHIMTMDRDLARHLTTCGAG